MGTIDREYVLGTDPGELQRLGLQHQLWSESAHRLWERAGIKPGMRVLDVGCGPGYAAFDLAQMVGPDGAVVGVDESEPFLAYMDDQITARRLGHVECHPGDVTAIRDVLSGHEQFDFAYARWVLCFVRERERAVEQVAGLLRSGSPFVIQDYFNYTGMTLAPRRPAFNRVMRAVEERWIETGGDPDVVGHLPAMLRRHGFEVEHIAVNARVARPGTTFWNWPDSFWRGFLPKLLESNAISRTEHDEFLETWNDACTDPDTFMFVPPVFDLIARR